MTAINTCSGVSDLLSCAFTESQKMALRCRNT